MMEESLSPPKGEIDRQRERERERERLRAKETDRKRHKSDNTSRYCNDLKCLFVSRAISFSPF